MTTTEKKKQWSRESSRRYRERHPIETCQAQLRYWTRKLAEAQQEANKEE